jgi:hypothetical protein
METPRRNSPDAALSPPGVLLGVSAGERHPPSLPRGVRGVWTFRGVVSQAGLDADAAAATRTCCHLLLALLEAGEGEGEGEGEAGAA